MTDREKVIKGLNYCTHTDGSECPNCPYWQVDNCVNALNADVLSLLKEQESEILKFIEGVAKLVTENERLKALLKEQEEEIENLKQTAQSMMEGICLLKEQNNCENCAVAIEDRQPIVRCLDCRFWQSRVSRIIDGKECNFCEIVKGYKPADWFCADGERKEWR